MQQHYTILLIRLIVLWRKKVDRFRGLIMFNIRWLSMLGEIPRRSRLVLGRSMAGCGGRSLECSKAMGLLLLVGMDILLIPSLMDFWYD